MFPPVKVEPNPRLIPVFAPITLDRIRGMDNPMSMDRHVLRHVVEGWSAFEPNEMVYRGYYNNLACPQFPFSQLDRVRNEIPVYKSMGIDMMNPEVIRQSWASSPITLYVATKLMWNVKADVDALLTEFYDLFYGPAAQPMQAYHEAVESAFRDTSSSTGSSYVYFPVFDLPRRDRLRKFLDSAAQQAGGPEDAIYAERVRMNRMAFDRLEVFLNIIEARNRFDFASAHKMMEQEYYPLSDAMADYVLEEKSIYSPNGHRLLSTGERSDHPRNYFNWFFRDAITSGYHRAVEIGEVVQGLPDEWDFLLDPAEIGEIAGYLRPGQMGDHWKPMKTVSRSWSDQGLHYYKGVAWYRTRVRLPEGEVRRPIYLWSGGVDNTATVWVNGQLIGTSREPGEGLPGVSSSFQPFDLDATEAVQPGEDNWIVVRIEKRRLAELRTGGIVAPVMFWSPHDPHWRPGD